jgi:predicted nucleic acid-binding protein
VNEQAVTDSTCLIGWERIGRLDLLPALFIAVLEPPEVDRELGRRFAWLKIQKPQDSPQLQQWKALVDDGEAEAIALAQETGYQLILDDLQARALARRFGIRIIGTVGLLVRAKQAGIIPLLKPVMNQLKAGGFFIGIALEQEALRLVGEL